MMKKKAKPKRQPKPKRCLFCDRDRPLTNEHVFPDWLRKLGFTGPGTREIVEDSSTPIFQQGGRFTKVLKVVCGPCNNVWMKGIEDAAKPVLVSMFRAAASGKQVSLDEAAQLATCT